MKPDRTDCLDLLLTIARRMRFLFGCFGAKDDDGDDTNPLIPEARRSLNEAPFPLENKPASLHVREESQLSNWVCVSKEHRVVFKDMESGSKSADNNVDGDNNDMVLKDEVPFPLENKSASLHVCEEHRVVFKGVENGSRSTDNNVAGDNDDMVLNNEVPYPLENKPASLHVHEEHRVVCKDVENASQSADNNIDGHNDDMVGLKDEVPFLLATESASLHLHEEHRVAFKDVGNDSQSADNDVDGDNDDMAVLMDEIPFLLENKPASLHVQEGNNVDGEIDDQLVLQDEVPFLLENKPASLHVQEENNVDGDDDYLVVLKDEVPFLLENEPASLHVHEDYRVVFKDEEIASQSEDNTVDGDNDDMVVVMVEAELPELSCSLLETTSEIQKASKTMEATPDDGDDTASKFHSLFTGTSGMKLNLEKQPDQVPSSPAQFHEEPGMPLMSENSDFPELNLSSFDIFESPTTEVQRQNQTNRIDSPRGSAFASPVSLASPFEMPAHSNSSNASPTVTHESPASLLDVPTHSNSSDASSTVTHESPASPLDAPAHSNSSNASSTVTLESPASLEVPAHSNSSDDSLTVTPELSIATTQGKKIVRFKCDASVNWNDDFLPSSSSPAKSETQTCNRSDSSGTDDGRGPLPGPQHSPYPTPLKLTDEMQTPGTVYPAKLITTAIQNDTGIQYQSVYPFPTSMGNLGLLEQCPEEDVEQIIDAKLELLLKACEKYTSDPTVPDERAERRGWDSISSDGLDFMRDDSDSMSRDGSDSLSSEDGANVN